MTPNCDCQLKQCRDIICAYPMLSELCDYTDVMGNVANQVVAAFIQAPGLWACPKAHLNGMTTISSGSDLIVIGNYPSTDTPHGAPRQLSTSVYWRKNFFLMLAGEDTTFRFLL